VYRSLEKLLDLPGVPVSREASCAASLSASLLSSCEVDLGSVVFPVVSPPNEFF